MTETVARVRQGPTRSGRKKLYCSVRGSLWHRLEQMAEENGDTLSAYAARVLAKHAGMEP